MKVRELIEELKKFNPDLDVMTDGFEGGVDEVETVELIAVRRDVNDEWYYGRHKELRNRDRGENDSLAVKIY